jgi:hypothetical protein
MPINSSASSPLAASTCDAKKSGRNEQREQGWFAQRRAPRHPQENPKFQAQNPKQIGNAKTLTRASIALAV